MSYFACYLLVGFALVVFKSPIQALVDRETGRIEISCLTRGQKASKKKLLFFRLIVSTILMLIYPIMLFADLQENRRKRKEIKRVSRPEPISRASWLGKKISVREVEEKYLIDVDGQQVPFGSFGDQWKCFLKLKKLGDELHEFRSPDESWASLSGVEGIALIRKGKIIAEIITRMS